MPRGAQEHLHLRDGHIMMSSLDDRQLSTASEPLPWTTAIGANHHIIGTLVSYIEFLTMVCCAACKQFPNIETFLTTARHCPTCAARSLHGIGD
jgi:hypothetical protein